MQLGSVLEQMILALLFRARTIVEDQSNTGVDSFVTQVTLLRAFLDQ